MLRISSKINEEFSVEGIISLKIVRTLRLTGTFDLEIYKDDRHLLTLTKRRGFLTFKYALPHNESGFEIDVLHSQRFKVDNDILLLKVKFFMLFRKKYARVLYNDKHVGEVFFRKKLVDIIVEFIPSADFEMNEDQAMKIALLISLNIANLDISS